MDLWAVVPTNDDTGYRLCVVGEDADVAKWTEVYRLWDRDALLRFADDHNALVGELMVAKLSGYVPAAKEPPPHAPS